MAALHRLGLLEIQMFNFRGGSDGQDASPCQISCRSVKPLLRYGDFFFKMATYHHLAFAILNV